MKRHFRRHLQRGDTVTRPSEGPADGVPRLRVPEGDDETTLSSAPSAGDAVTRPSEGPADGVPRLRVPEGDDETPLSSAPSGLPWNKLSTANLRGSSTKVFPGIANLHACPAEFLLTQKQIQQQNDGNHTQPYPTIPCSNISTYPPSSPIFLHPLVPSSPTCDA